MTTATTATTVRTDGTKAGDTVTGRFTRKNLPGFDVAEVRKPVYAVAGFADFALEQVKDMPADVTAEVQRVQALLADVPAQVKTLPDRVGTATEKASDFYAKLAIRGERLVTQIRRQPATEAAIAEGKEAVRKAEAAAIAARKAGKAGEQAVEDAAAKIG